jgi:glycosyltransferase involved in cell wall biosynthesis
MIKVALVVPCYNEEDVLPETCRRLLETLTGLERRGIVSADSAVYFVDDGSTDRTWELVADRARRDPRVHGIRLSRNKGHQTALLAGLHHAEGDVVVTVDADLQDDLGAVEEMLRHSTEGSDIVYGVRRSRNTDTFWKRNTALGYYRALGWLGIEVIDNHADFRLMSRRAVDAVLQYPEVNVFLRGLIPLLGFSSSTVYYDRDQRFAGVSKYPLRRMLGLAIDGVTSFSVAPLRLVSGLGLLVATLSAGMIGWVLFGSIVWDTVIPGWASSVLPIYFLGGLQLLSLGVVGEYVAKIYLETKRRPRFFIDKVV